MVPDLRPQISGPIIFLITIKRKEPEDCKKQQAGDDIKKKKSTWKLHS